MKQPLRGQGGEWLCHGANSIIFWSTLRRESREKIIEGRVRLAWGCDFSLMRCFHNTRVLFERRDTINRRGRHVRLWRSVARVELQTVVLHCRTPRYASLQWEIAALFPILVVRCKSSVLYIYVALSVYVSYSVSYL